MSGWMAVAMSNSRKARGTAWETAVVNFLRRETGGGIPVFKPRQEGQADCGDIHVDADFVLQCKDWKSWSKQDAYNFVDAADEQARVAARPWGVSVVKRRKAAGSSGSVASGLVSMSLDTFAAIVHDLAEGREALSREMEEFE